jgi:hypothetical protein
MRGWKILYEKFAEVALQRGRKLEIEGEREEEEGRGCETAVKNKRVDGGILRRNT